MGAIAIVVVANVTVVPKSVALQMVVGWTVMNLAGILSLGFKTQSYEHLDVLPVVTRAIAL